MSPASSIAVPRAGFNLLPLCIALFCLLWSFAFVAGKIAVTDCPPLILLAARFSLAGLLILGSSGLRRDSWSLSWRDTIVFAIIGVANNALYLGLGYTGLQTISAGLGALIVSANPVFTAAFAALFLGEQLTSRKVTGLLLGIIGVGFIVWHRMSVGTDSLHGILFTLARWRRSSPAPSCSRCWRQRAVCGSAMACRISPEAWQCCRSRSPSRA
jgi:drug/metabolite transporter (DMT)-like permease